MLEKKPRRSELALYVLPRAGDSLWEILVNRHVLPDIKNAEVLTIQGTKRSSSLIVELLFLFIQSMKTGGYVLCMYGRNHVLPRA